MVFVDPNLPNAKPVSKEIAGAPPARPQMMSVDDIRDALFVRNFKSLRHLMRVCEPADIAEAFRELELGEAIVLFRLIPSTKKSQVFAKLSLDHQTEFINKLPDPVMSPIINDMEPVDRTQLLEALPFEIGTKLLLKLEPEERQMARQLLSYPEHSVGRLTTPEFVTLRGDLKAAQAIDYLRWNTKETGDMGLEHIFVTDDAQIYLGEVRLADLVTADPPSLSVRELMRTWEQTLTVFDDETKAVDYFRKYDRTFFPVLDEKRQIIGVVTADDMFDVAEEEATEDIQQFGGLTTLEHSYFETSYLSMLRKRGLWLSAIFVGELFTGTALRHYDAAISQWRYLVYFVPLILSSGGNSGAQAASLVIRGLAVQEMKISDWWRVFGREVLMGVVLGAILGLVGFARAMAWGNTWQVGLIIFLSLVGCVTTGAVLGSMVPFIIKRFNMDPAVSSSPFIATFVDVVGIVIFFNVALIVMHILGAAG